MTTYDATERAFKNGAEYMRELIINKLLDNRGRAMGLERSVLGDVVELVKKLEVRV